MKLLKIGISGVRGIVGETITPELVMNFACAFATSVDSGKVLLGRDSRRSGPMIQAAVQAALLSSGCDIVDLGICPTPILQYMVKRLKTRGGISITAGHNGEGWNALTFINSEGTYLTEYQGEKLLDIYHLERFNKVPVDDLGRISPLKRHIPAYFKALTRFLNSGAIRDRGFKLVIDPCNGGGAGYIDNFCHHLGCELVPVNNEPSGYFPHDPEPRPRYATLVASVIKITGGDAGFLLNSDVSRVSIVTEEGETLSEEYALPLIAEYYLKSNPGRVVTNHCTSRMIDDVAADHGCSIIRAKVGQSHSLQTLRDEDGILAGEGSGGVAIRKFQPAFDGFLTMGMILEMMAVRRMKLSEMIGALPKYHIVKEKIYCPPVKAHSIVSEIKILYTDLRTEESDGLKVETDGGWIHIRASATEPMIRIIAEDTSQERARLEIEKAANFITQHV